MKKVICYSFILLSNYCTYAQTTANKAAHNAFLITRMAAKLHIQPKQLNDSFSIYVYNALLQHLDEDKIFFTMEDISALLPYQHTIDDEVLQLKTVYLRLLASHYEARLEQADTMIANICKQPFNFSLNEKLTVAEDTSYPANASAMRSKLGKLMKMTALSALMEQKEFMLLNNMQQKKYVDSIEPILRHKVQAVFQRSIHTILQSPGGVPQYTGDEYCKAIALYYDPHTEYFPATEKEDF